MNQGKLYGVGIGPGDPELITLKAVRIMHECDVIAVPETRGEKTVAFDIAVQAVPELAQKERLQLFMPMTRDKTKAVKSRDEAADKIMDLLKEGKNIAFLTLGDPSIYSTYLYTHRRVLNAGFCAEIISGVPSFCAVAAKLNIGLVEGNEPLVILPALYDESESLLAQHGTKVLMKNGKEIPKIKKQLTEYQLYEKASMVQNCGLKDERVFTSLDDVDDDAHYFSVIVVKEEEGE